MEEFIPNKRTGRSNRKGFNQYIYKMTEVEFKTITIKDTGLEKSIEDTRENNETKRRLKERY